ncbi:GspE/PulE family protein [Leucobacter denitrificans]|uniref:GspE/PulE family protein n=1 Tax=Leucobacter denitrificans TaxID=683042 RepID=UPI001FE3D374|nr:ATPase, T2SS/T4P/T4SS family [Leucobacter denitrificans]
MSIAEGWQHPRGTHGAAPVSTAEQLATDRGLGYVNLFETDIDLQMVELVTTDLCRRHRVIPVTISEHRVRLAMVDPSDIIAIDDVASATGRTVTPLVASAEAMEYALTRFARLDQQIAELSSELSAQAAALDLDRAADENSGALEDAPIVQFVNLIISQAIQDRASDIHIEPADGVLRVRYRIDGVLREVQNASASIASGVVSRMKIMSNIDISERRLPQDGRMTVKHRGREVDLRVATLPTLWGEKVVMRILDTPAEQLRLTDLEMSERNYDVFQASFKKPHGMVLVTGPTGSGKSTTLYMTLHEIVRPEINVITVEDPVEYRMDGVNQMQVNPRAGLTFDSALRSILRSDPDVVLVGEIRDSETAQTSIEAALTGHLVLSTLHTNDAPSAASRLVEMGIEPFLVASALDSVMAQRLARRLCKDCVIVRQPSPEVLESIGFVVPGGMAQVGEPQGCSRCSGTGYRGRVAIHEVMRVTQQIAQLIVAGASNQDLRSVAIEQGMVPLREDGWRKVLAGATSIEEVLRVTV